MEPPGYLHSAHDFHLHPRVLTEITRLLRKTADFVQIHRFRTYEGPHTSMTRSVPHRPRGPKVSSKEYLAQAMM